MLKTHRRERPLSVDAIKQVLLHRFVLKRNFFDYHMVDCSVFHQVHLLHIVENERIITLLHKEVFHTPIFFLNALHHLIVLVNVQRKLYARQLQFAVCSEIKNKIIEQLIGRLGHGLFFYNTF